MKMKKGSIMILSVIVVIIATGFFLKDTIAMVFLGKGNITLNTYNDSLLSDNVIYVWDLVNSLQSLLESDNTFAIMVIAVIFLSFVLQKKIKQFKIYRSGVKGERMVSKMLRKISKGRFVVMDNVMLPLYSNTTQIDHIVVGPFGVVCIETKNHSGEIIGGIEDIYWIQRLGSKTHLVYNPLAQNNTHVQVVRYILHKERILNVPVYNLVVFSSNNVSIKLDEENVPVIPIRYLKEYFQNKAFNESRVNVAEVVAAIKKHQITDKSVQKRHIRQLKKAYS